MRAHQHVGRTFRVASEARPSVSRGIAHKAGADRVRLDVATACEIVSLRVDRRGAIPPFPQRTRTSVARVEVKDVFDAQ